MLPIITYACLYILCITRYIIMIHQNVRELKTNLLLLRSVLLITILEIINAYLSKKLPYDRPKSRANDILENLNFEYSAYLRHQKIFFSLLDCIFHVVFFQNYKILQCKLMEIVACKGWLERQGGKHCQGEVAWIASWI